MMKKKMGIYKLPNYPKRKLAIEFEFKQNFDNFNSEIMYFDFDYN